MKHPSRPPWESLDGRRSDQSDSSSRSGAGNPRPAGQLRPAKAQKMARHLLGKKAYLTKSGIFSVTIMYIFVWAEVTLRSFPNRQRYFLLQMKRLGPPSAFMRSCPNLVRRSFPNTWRYFPLKMRRLGLPNACVRSCTYLGFEVNIGHYRTCSVTSH